MWSTCRTAVCGLIPRSWAMPALVRPESVWASGSKSAFERFVGQARGGSHRGLSEVRSGPLSRRPRLRRPGRGEAARIGEGRGERVDHLVELGAVAGQRRCDLDHRVAAAVGAGAQPRLQQAVGQEPAQEPLALLGVEAGPRLFGYPDETSGAMPRLCDGAEVGAGRQRADAWRLPAQLDTDPETGSGWGGGQKRLRPSGL